MRRLELFPRCNECGSVFDFLSEVLEAWLGGFLEEVGRVSVAVFEGDFFYHGSASGSPQIWQMLFL